MTQPLLSIILPAYNSGDHIEKSINHLRDFLKSSGISGEIIVVDDGSGDSTSSLVENSSDAKLIRLDRNCGKGAALRAGVQAANGTVRMFTDSDIPYGTEPILLALDLIQNRNFHAVLGDRRLPGASYNDVGLIRQFISAAASLFVGTIITGDYKDTQCGFKVFRGDVAQHLFALTRIDRFAIDVEIIYLLLKYQLDVKRIPVNLSSHIPSTVKVFRDSLRAVWDIIKIPLNWYRGFYRSEELREIWRGSLSKGEKTSGH